MAEYGRGFDWYMSDDCVFRPSDREDMFVPSGCSYIEMWNYPVGNSSRLLMQSGTNEYRMAV